MVIGAVRGWCFDGWVFLFGGKYITDLVGLRWILDIFDWVRRVG